MNTKKTIGIDGRIQSHAPYTAKQYAAIALAIGAVLMSSIALVIALIYACPSIGKYIVIIVAVAVFEAWSYIVEALDAIETWAANKAAPKAK